MFPRVNGGDRHDNNFLQAPPTGLQMNYPHMDVQLNPPPDAPGNNIPTNAQIWIVNPAPRFNNLPGTQQWIAVPQNTQSSDFHKTFLKAKPKALGIVLIIVGILQIVLGIGSIFTTFYIMMYTGITFWGPIFYIIAGSLSVAGHYKPSICLVKGSLGLNIFTSVFTIAGLTLTIVDFTPHHYFYFWAYDCYYYDYDCTGLIQLPGAMCCYSAFCQLVFLSPFPSSFPSCIPCIIGHVIRSLFVITNLLLFCISVSISVFACQALKNPPTVPPQVFVVQNDATFSLPPSAYPGHTPAYAQSSPTPANYYESLIDKGGPTQ